MNDVKTVLEEKRIQVESYLKELPRGGENLLTESMAYSLLAGGKRLRPALFLLTAEMYGQKGDELLPFAAGLELIHTYSLIHDDLPAMDNDDYRRGKLTNHKVFGEAQAILAGDGLLTEAFYMMTKAASAVPAERVLKAITAVSDLAGIGGMVRGQTFDIEGETKELSLEALQAIHRDKTGALLRAAILSGAYLGNAPEKDCTALDRYGHFLGMEFQIVDDILDHESSFEELGKPIGSDEANHKTTYVSLLGLDGAKKAAEQAEKEAEASLGELSVNASLLCDLGKMLLKRKK